MSREVCEGGNFGVRLAAYGVRSPNIHVVPGHPPHQKNCGRRISAGRFIAKMKSLSSTAAASCAGFLPRRALRIAATLSALGMAASHLGAATAAEPGAAVPPPAVVPATPSAPVTDLGKTVVVASRREERLADVSPSVSVVTATELSTRQVRTLAEALAYSPGVIVATTGAPGGNQSVFTRGTNSDMTAVLLDGRRVTPGFSNSSEIERFSLAGISSVEFLRGPSSTLYGANALGGVIDLRTANTLSLSRNGGWAEAEIGKFGYTDFAVEASGNTDNSGDDALVKGLGASVAYSQSDTDNKRVNNDFTRSNLTQKTEYRISDSLSVEVLNQYYESKAGVPGSLTFPSPNQRLDRNGWMTSPGLKYDNHDGVRASTFYSYSFARLDSYGASFGAPTRSEIDMQEVGGQVEVALSSAALLTLGYSYQNTRFDRENRTTTVELAGSPHWESHSPWARIELISPDSSLRVGAGTRYQHFDEFDDALTGEVFGSYKIKETSTLLSAKLATAYSTPSAASYQNPPLNELKPQETQAWELGVRQELLKRTLPTEIGVVYFENRMENLISSRSASGQFRAFNALEARTRGVELFTEIRPAKQLLLFANATIQDARYTENQPQFNIVSGDKLLRRPDYMTTLGLEIMPVETVTLGVSGTGVMRREDFGHIDQADYFVGRVYGHWQFTKNARFFARLENVADENYDAAGNGSPALPLAAYVGIRVSF